MINNQQFLINKSEILFKNISTFVCSSDLKDSIQKDYLNLFSKKYLKLNRKPKSLKQDDYMRISFEIYCFAIFIIMGQEMPKYLIKKTIFSKSKPNMIDIRFFNDRLLQLLEKSISLKGIDKLSEIIVEV
ncbi:MAG: hypothetical protein H8E11_03225 [Candidatus Cloacimonetes bacterium]|nr:hypothetical protein [Candidatus Cloacimonadota bacterium]